MNNIFNDKHLKSNLRQGIDKIGFKRALPVQQKVIPLLLAGKNVVVQSQTGSGKTHAYLLPIFNEMTPQNVVQAIITVPSRELAQQVYGVAQTLKKAASMNISIIDLAGGQDRNRQVERFKGCKPQIVIATPGRLHDFISKKVFALDGLKYFIIDEADMTLDMGFLPVISEITSKLKRDTAIAAFSATIPVNLANFLRQNLYQAQEIVIDNPAVIAPTIKNDLLDIGAKNRKEILYQLLTMGQPYLALVFANTKEHVDVLTAYLRDKGLKVAKIHGGITERARKRTLRQVEEGRFQYVVATDLAARGIDIAGVSLVINYEIPKDLEFVIHRIGRTGRNGLKGHAITLVKEEDMGQVASLEKMGVHFDFVQLQSGELKPRPHFRRREFRKYKTDAIDNKLRGYVKKERKKRKPGYRNKIRHAFAENRRQKQKRQRVHEKRHAQRLRRRRRKGNR